LDEKEKTAADDSFKYGGYKNNNKYLLLYLFLAKDHGPFDPHLFDGFLKKNGIKENTSRIYSKRIYERIISILLEIRADRDYFYTIQRHIAQANILFEKEFFELAEEELKSARKLEKAYNFPSVRYAIEMLDARILFQKDLKSINEPLRQHHDAALKAVADFNRDAKIRITYQFIFSYHLHNKDTQSEWEELSNALAGIELPEKYNPEILFYYTSVKTKIALHEKKLAEIFTWAEKLYLLFKNNPDYQKEYTLAYLATVDNYLSALGQLRDFSRISPILEELEPLEFSIPKLHTRKETTIIFHQMTMICNDKAMLKALNPKQVEHLKVRFNNCEKGMLPPRKIATNLLFGIFYLLRFDYPAAEEFFSRINAHRSDNLRSDFQRIKLIIKTLIQLEDREKPDHFTEKSIDNLYDRLFDWEGLNSCEKTTITFFRKWNHSPKSRRELIPIFSNFKEKLAEEKDSQGNLPLIAEILTEWLTHKIEDPYWR
jgi:hypothetical protein